jgi:putative phosphoesterase
VKIGIIGDTHGSIQSLIKILDLFSEVELFLHTGDHWQDGAAVEQKTGIPVLTVKGNCDRGKMSSELVFTIARKKVFLTHGHLYGVKSGLNTLLTRAGELSADYCVFGHTHRAMIEKRKGIWLLNPGSMTWSRVQKNYAGILMEVQNNIFVTRYIDIDMY